MKSLLLTTEKLTAVYGEFYYGLHKQLGSMDTRRLNNQEQANLKNYFSDNVEVERFDRIILHLDFDVLKPQQRFLRQLNRVVFYNTDAHSGKEASFNGITRQVEFFKKMPWAKIIVSNFRAMQKFQDAGLDAWCVPEGFNPSVYTSSSETRSIELAFIENSDVPETSAVSQLKKQLIRVYPDLYLESNIVAPAESQLSNVQMAICADIGRREFSAKVFQSMASGCLTFSHEQGIEESFYLSLKDMENIVLFDSFEMLCDRIEYFKNQPEKARAIAQKGYELVMEHHQKAHLGRQAGNYIVAGMREREDYDGLGFSLFGFRF